MPKHELQVLRLEDAGTCKYGPGPPPPQRTIRSSVEHARPLHTQLEAGGRVSWFECNIQRR